MNLGIKTEPVISLFTHYLFYFGGGDGGWDGNRAERGRANPYQRVDVNKRISPSPPARNYYLRPITLSLCLLPSYNNKA